MSIEQMAEELGLQDFDTFALEARWRLADVRLKYGSMPVHEVMHRMQGHSTRNVLAALCRLREKETGDVLLVASNPSMQRLLVQRAGDWALRLGLDPRRIKGTTARSPYLMGRDPADVFVDHVVHEYPEAC